MALRETVQAFSFSSGIETKQNPLKVPMPKLLVLENGVFSRGTSIIKRNGLGDLGQAIEGSTSTVVGAIRMARRGSELLEFTPNRCYSRESGDSQWSDVGAVFSAVGADRPLVTTGTDQTMCDQAENGGIRVVAWEDSAVGVWWSVVDASSGRVYRAAAQADSAGISPRCVSVGGNLHVYWANPTLGAIRVLVINPLAPAAAVTPLQLTADLSATTPTYDVAPTGRAGSPSIVAWCESGTSDIRVGYVHQSGILGSVLLGLPAVKNISVTRGAGTPLAIDYLTVDGGTADVVGLAFISNTNAGRALSFNGVLTNTGTRSVYTATNVQRIALVVTGSDTTMTLAFEETAAQASNHFVVVVDGVRPATASGTQSTIRSVGLVSKGFHISGAAFATFVHDTTFFNTYLTLKISGIGADGVIPIGRHLPGSAAGLPVRKHLSSVTVTDSVAKIAVPMRQRLVSENDDKFLETAPRLITIDFDSDQSHQTVEFGKGLYMAGACPMHYDGRIWSELGFSVGPEVITVVKAAGGSMTSGAVYEYRCWYEWTDAQGEVHPGPTSPGILVTMGGGDTQVTLTLPTCRLTRKSGVRIMVARSLPGSDGNASQLWRVSSLDTTTSGAANGYVANSTSVDTVTFLDRMSDATLQTFDELYTDGGILSNDPTPLGSAIARGKDRLFASDPSDPTIVRYSQPFADGFGVQWPPELFLRIDLQGGSVQGLGAIDDRIIIWTEHQIWTFAGDGPDATGGSDTTGFSRPQLLPGGDIGCTDPQSIVFTPRGYMFKSPQGIWELGGDSTINYRGAPVEGFNSQTIRRAVQLPDRTQVLFLTDSGKSLLYDYLFDQWSTFTNYEGRDCVVVDGRLNMIRTDGRVFFETPGVYSDNGVRIRLRIETAWIHMVEYLQGFQKFFNFHLLGTWVSAHQLGVQYQTDYTQGWNDAVWFDATGETDPTAWISGSNVVGAEPISGSEYDVGQYSAGPYGGIAPGEYAWRLDLYEVGQSIQFRFEDFERAGLFGPSFELTELVITGGVLGTVRRPMTAGRSG